MNNNLIRKHMHAYPYHDNAHRYHHATIPTHKCTQTHSYTLAQKIYCISACKRKAVCLLVHTIGEEERRDAWHIVSHDGTDPLLRNMLLCLRFCPASFITFRNQVTNTTRYFRGEHSNNHISHYSTPIITSYDTQLLKSTDLFQLEND